MITINRIEMRICMDNNTLLNTLLAQNPALSSLSPEKRNFLMNFANAKKPVKMQEMMPFLLSSMNQAKKENIQFTASESDLLIELLKQNLSPEESHKVDMMMRIMHPKK